MAFNAINKAPGVYIEEVQLPGPIPGVGTSTAAFVGPAKRGPINKPVFLTNRTQFLNTFGSPDPLDPFGPYITDPPIYVTHAVLGFFDAGGTSCYFVRAGTGKQAWLQLPDTKDSPTLVVRAKKDGVTGTGNKDVKIKVQVEPTSIVNSVSPFQVDADIPLDSASKDTAQVGGDDDKKKTENAAKFRPGDTILIRSADNSKSDTVTINRISGAQITFRGILINTYNAADKATTRIADLSQGQRRIRLDKIDGIEPGSYIGLTQVQGTVEKTESQVVQSVDPANKAIALAQGLSNSYTMEPGKLPTLKTLEFTLILQTPALEQYVNLSIDPRHSRYFSDIVDSQMLEVALVDPPNPTLPPGNLPRKLAATELNPGADDVIKDIGTAQYQSAIDALEKIDDVNILCVPDRTDQDVQAYMIAHCEKMQDRFTILDPRVPAKDVDPLTDIKDQRKLINSDRGFGALYFPRIVITNPVGQGHIAIPPSGHIAGVYARVDNDRGVHKAPANETIRGVLALEHTLTDDEQGPLNELGVNVIRSFPGSGIRVWGARTIAPQDRTQWRYVNVRRLLLFIEESIQEGTQFAVFEPNNLSLWGQLKRQVTDFLTRVWRDGALFGATAEEAFRVRIDEELNPPDLRALGQLVIEVIVVPTTPAEFIVFRIISDTTGKALIQE